MARGPSQSFIASLQALEPQGVIKTRSSFHNSSEGVFAIIATVVNAVRANLVTSVGVEGSTSDEREASCDAHDYASNTSTTGTTTFRGF